MTLPYSPVSADSGRGFICLPIMVLFTLGFSLALVWLFKKLFGERYCRCRRRPLLFGNKLFVLVHSPAAFADSRHVFKVGCLRSCWGSCCFVLACPFFACIPWDSSLHLFDCFRSCFIVADCCWGSGIVIVAACWCRCCWGTSCFCCWFAPPPPQLLVVAGMVLKVVPLLFGCLKGSCVGGCWESCFVVTCCCRCLFCCCCCWLAPPLPRFLGALLGALLPDGFLSCGGGGCCCL